jgi:hypothetical protein
MTSVWSKFSKKQKMTALFILALIGLAIIFCALIQAGYFVAIDGIAPR